MLAIPIVNKSCVLGFLWRVPPLPEQRAIAHVLRTVQRAKEATEKVIGATKQLKKSLTAHLFTSGAVSPDTAAQVRVAQTDIGTNPAHWTLAKLGDVARIGNGSTPKRDRPEYWEGGDIPWLTSGKIHDSVIAVADEFVTETAREECYLPLVKASSLLVAITGQGKTLGNAAMVLFDTCISQHLAYVQIESGEILPEFLLHYLQTDMRNFIVRDKQGEARKGH